MTFASTAALTPYFSIDAGQSAASGLPVYNAAGGMRSYGVGALARYEWSQRWATHFFVTYDRLTDAAANSPVVALARRRQSGADRPRATYAFDLGF